MLVAQASFGGPLLTAVTGAATIGDGLREIDPPDGSIMDRGLPSTGVYAGGTNPNWSQRTNIGGGDYDRRDPIWAADDFGPPELAGDTFTMPGVAAQYVTDLRLWWHSEKRARPPTALCSVACR